MLSIMNHALLCFCCAIFLSAVTVKTEYYPDISNEEYEKFRQYASYMQKKDEEFGRPTGDIPDESDLDNSNYLAKIKKENSYYDYSLGESNQGNDDSSVFAVGPSDPRYFQGFSNPIIGEEAENPHKESLSKMKTLETTSKVWGQSTGDVAVASEVHQVPVANLIEEENKADLYFTAIVAGCSAAAVVSIIVIGITCYSNVKDYLDNLKEGFDTIKHDMLHKNAKAAANVDYPAYGVTGPNKDISPTSGDRRLAQSAQMYHYQHQKQQIIAMESMNNKERRSSISDAESEEENEEGDYTVYECPGLAPTGEMEVKNPLFQEDRPPETTGKSAMKLNEESQELPK